MNFSCPVDYYAWWFAPVEGTDMKRTRLNVFLRLGEVLNDLGKVTIGQEPIDVVLNFVRPWEWIGRLHFEIRDLAMPETQTSVKKLHDFLSRWIIPGGKEGHAFLTKFNQTDMLDLKELTDKFRASFEKEEDRLAVFAVTPKGLYDTGLLIDHPELKFPQGIRNLLPPQMLVDLKEAAKCLAFDVPTGCAFHTCRGTESLILHYHEKLSGKTWSFKKRDWKIYVEQLSNAGAPKDITNRLNEIRELDRNAYIHPDVNVSIEEAPVLFELCTGVIFRIGQELEKLNP